MIDPETASARASRYKPAGAVDYIPPTASTLPATTTYPARRPPVRRATGGPLYGGYSEQQLTADPSLVARLGRAGAARWAGAHPATPALPPTTAPAPGPTGGVTTQPVTEQPPTSNGAPGPPVGGPFVPFPQPSGGPSDLTDPMMMFMSAIPAMRLNSTKNIGDAMAQAGFTGNRWGSSAMRTAGQIGAEEGLQENALLQSLLNQYANNQENRALQATQQGAQVGGLLDQLAGNRITLPASIGQYEQGRQDDIARMLFGDWQQNRLGWLGPFLQAAAGQGAGSPGSPGQIYTTTTPGKPGASDWLTLLGSLFG